MGGTCGNCKKGGHHRSTCPDPLTDESCIKIQLLCDGREFDFEKEDAKKAA